VAAPVFEEGKDGWLQGRVAFTTQDVLSNTECSALINHAESLGFEKALLNVGYGRQILDEDTRKSQRLIIDSTVLAEAVWARIEHLVPARIASKRANGRDLVVVGLNERLRLLKYLPGDVFQPHCDGCFARGDEFSVLTLQLYLNECEDGGETTMWSNEAMWRDKDDKPSEEDAAHAERRVVCRPGQALVFSHRIWHEGSVVKKGVKYVIRTDVMYKYE
ncbi:hypothetical protein BC830DRAFT_1174370, partial [Chytriomyces sp. MP71]